MQEPVVIIQAGGRGSRLRHHTWNKPKSLVSVKGKPLLYHAFDSFPKSQFIIIGDYHYDVIDTYLKVVPCNVSYNLIKASKKGTSSGIKEALSLISNDTPVILLWGDIIFNEPPSFIQSSDVIIYVTDEFICRWVYDTKTKQLKESPSPLNGVVGYFQFPNKTFLNDVPNGGEFV